MFWVLRFLLSLQKKPGSPPDPQLPKEGTTEEIQRALQASKAEAMGPRSGPPTWNLNIPILHDPNPPRQGRHR